MDLKPCYDTWSRQGEGYVFISEKSSAGWKDHKAFKWPADKRKVGALVGSRSNGRRAGNIGTGIHKGSGSDEGTVSGDGTGNGIDLYWCPLVFSGPRRDIKLSQGGNVLYADLDPVDPRGLEIRPTIAWESSPGRYQALWWIDRTLQPEEFERINKGLTYHVGADKSGWDLTQVLRIPGSWNHKTDPPKPGKLLWQETHVFNTEHIPLASGTRGPVQGRNVTLVGLLSKYRKKFPTKVSQLLQYPDRRVTPGKRSEILWYIESELIKAKIPMEDIIQMVRLSAWNKYKGRRDEEKRLMTEIQKVYENQEDFNEDQDDEPEEVEEEDEKPRHRFKTYHQMMSAIDTKPGWLVEDIWLRGSHGMVAGEPKTFKSTITMDLAISVASGRPFLNKYKVMETGPVIILQNENAEWIMKDRTEKITASKDLIGSVKWPSVTFAPELPITFLNNSGYNLSDPGDMEILEDMIKTIKPILVILDPLYLMFEGDINSAKDLMPVLQWLMHIKNTYRTSVLVVHHWNKGGASPRGGQRMLGSTTLHGWVESAMYFSVNGESTSDEGTFSKVKVEREFRAAGNLAQLDVEIQMGKIDVPIYIPKVSDLVGDGAGSANDLLDLLIMYPSGISQTQAAKELGIGRSRLSTLMDQAKGKIIVTPGQRGAQNIRLRGADDGAA